MITLKEKERRLKISLKLKGFKRPPFSKEHREKLRQVNLGKKLSEETKSKMFMFKKGNQYAKGLKHTEEWKRVAKLRVSPNLGKPNLRFKGENNPRWKGGITKLNLTIRHSLEMKNWRRAVFERDNYTCQICKERGGKLEAHHIKSFSLHPRLRFSIPNGKTLCEVCHQKIHKKYV